MYRVTALVSKQLSMTLALSGIQVEETTSVKQVEERLNSCLKEPGGIEILILEEHFRQDLSEWTRERLRRHKGKPLIVYCPNFETEELDVNTYLASVLKPALGYEIRLE